jgi:hypothetical protein
LKASQDGAMPAKVSLLEAQPASNRTEAAATAMIDLDLDNFFSGVGDAHAIQKINKSNLIAHHLIEYPDSSLTCVAQVICQDWWEILRIKLSYSKSYKTTPMLDNMTMFFPYCVDIEKEQQQLWNEFYSKVKNTTWPECDSFDNIVNLPVEIQQEINKKFVKASISIPRTEEGLVEWLTTTYYDMFCKLPKTAPHSKIILLGEYIQGNLAGLIDICESVMDWTWDSLRSQQFHKKMLLVNQKYFDWLDQIKTAVVSQTTSELAPWEQALVLAKWCVNENQHPKNLYWDSAGCNVDTNNLYLNLLRKHHGKTI